MTAADDRHARVLAFRLVLASLSCDADAYNRAIAEAGCAGCVVDALVDALAGALLLLVDNRPPQPPATPTECRERAVSDVQVALANLIDGQDDP
jgi:hypothetical protein